MLKQYKQDLFLVSEATKGFDTAYTKVIVYMKKLNRDYKKMMRRNKLDAFVTPSANCSPVLAIGGHPGISVPAGYDTKGVPVGFCFGGFKGTESKLIEIAYGFEQAINSGDLLHLNLDFTVHVCNPKYRVQLVTHSQLETTILNLYAHKRKTEYYAWFGLYCFVCSL